MEAGGRPPHRVCACALHIDLLCFQPYEGDKLFNSSKFRRMLNMGIYTYVVINSCVEFCSTFLVLLLIVKVCVLEYSVEI